MSRDKQITEARLHEALKRLLDGQGRHVKPKGRLTLNKVNIEAQLGNSYVHKFPDFVVHAKTLIEQFNHNRENSMMIGLDIEMGMQVSEIDKLKSELNRERTLKDKYRRERDNAIKARSLLEQSYSELVKRVVDLQNERQVREYVVSRMER
ncbi:hypothetical protein ACRWQN_12665 [Shewanella sp. HL-SH8]|uniref:hypothetical protein n=1 Tax=Shewanella sp. HL-SH8 TaxID=3436242 RepID=UPI003EBE51A7